VPRLMRAVEAGNLEATWRQWHEGKKGRSVEEGRLVAELKRLAKG
jgi:hypothetical protein